jgi:hypothetical protein
LSQSTIAPDIWNRELNTTSLREVAVDAEDTLNKNEHSECRHMNFIHQINCSKHRRQYPVVQQQQRSTTSTFVDGTSRMNEEMTEIHSAQHDLTVIDEYMEKAGKANAALTSADIKHNINWLLSEAKRERDGEFTAMDEYNRCYLRIPTRQSVVNQVNETETIAMQVQQQNVEMEHPITSPAHVLPPTRPRSLPLGVPTLEVALAALDNIQWKQTNQDDAQKELEKAFNFNASC